MKFSILILISLKQVSKDKESLLGRVMARLNVIGVKLFRWNPQNKDCMNAFKTPFE